MKLKTLSTLLEQFSVVSSQFAEVSPILTGILSISSDTRKQLSN